MYNYLSLLPIFCCIGIYTLFLTHTHTHTHTHTAQCWVMSLIPRSLWTRIAMYWNTVARRHSLREAQLTRGGQLFSRKVQNYPQSRHRFSSGSRATSDLSLRRTPSPRRRVSTVEPNQPARSALPKLEETTFAPIRTNTGSSFGSIPSPIPEDHMTSTPLHTPDTPLSSRAHVGGFRFSSSDILPLRSASAGSTTPPRSPGLRRQKHSRVLVVPSVATVTFVPQPPQDNVRPLEN